MNIVVVGLDHAGLSNAVVLAQHHDVVVVDPDRRKVDLLNQRRAPFADVELDDFLRHVPLSLTATTDETVFVDAHLVVVATPTDVDQQTHRVDASRVEDVIGRVLSANPWVTVVVRSTVPVGFTARMRERHDGAGIVYSPDLVEDGSALHGNLHPARIVVGHRGVHGQLFADLMTEGAVVPDVPVLMTDPTEAEAISLFANAYLALRQAYFDELASYSVTHMLDTAQVMAGVRLDPRIRARHSNPFFGDAGHLLPATGTDVRTPAFA